MTKLDKKVGPYDLMYRYKGSTAGAKFNEFDNALSLLGKIRDGKIRNWKYWNALQSKEQRYWIFWWLFFNGIWSKA